MADYDAHDDILDDDVARLTAAQRHVLTGTQDEHEGGICGEDVWV
ncbi:MAG: hypothetical protein SV966_08410 [Actinomycetota bacterium]|nr:hypothetical protein [Actinomycetota bacterium]